MPCHLFPGAFFRESFFQMIPSPLPSRIFMCWMSQYCRRSPRISSCSDYLASACGKGGVAHLGSPHQLAGPPIKARQTTEPPQIIRLHCSVRLFSPLHMQFGYTTPQVADCPWDQVLVRKALTHPSTITQTKRYS